MQTVGKFGEALRPFLLPISDLTPDPQNPRIHDDENLNAIRSSYDLFGQVKPIVYKEIDGRKIVFSGNGQLTVATELGWSHIAAVPFDGDEVRARAFSIADNRSAELGKWNTPILRMQTAQLLDWKPEVNTSWTPEVVGFTAEALDNVTREAPAPRKRAPETTTKTAPSEPTDEIIDVEVSPVEAATTTPLEVPDVAPGDMFALGRHRILCADSTDTATYARLLGDQKVPLLHADPPYGMGKEKDGVTNDNLYGDKLDAFQVSWLQAAWPHLKDNASVYIWGNPLDLWRLYLGHLNKGVTFKNEIVWEKGAQPGQRSPDMRCYAPNTERCLFLMLGQQEMGNVNAADYWDGWEPLRLALKQEVEKAGWSVRRVSQITGVSVRMAQHWFERSQWLFISADHYAELQDAARLEGSDAFGFDYAQVKALYDQFAAQYEDVKRGFYEGRAYFDNTHDNMTEVWSFPRVTGAERWGHPTPKPVDMLARALRSSCREGEAVLEPFLGSGSTLIAAEKTGRICYGIELEPKYVTTVIERWQKHTGQRAVRLEE